MKAADRSELNGAVALVTGAAVRLGRDLALGLAERGCDVALHCNRHHREALDLAREIRERGPRAEVFQADFSDLSAVQALALEVERRLGPPRYLVLSASRWREAALEPLEATEVDTTLRINLAAPMILGAAVGTAMKRRGAGSILTLLDWSIERPRSTFLPYEASKAGMRAVTLALAGALAPEVRVNGLALGAVLLPPNTDVATSDRIVRATPLARLGTPRDVVGSAMHLLLDAPFATGSILTLDGGRALR